MSQKTNISSFIVLSILLLSVVLCIGCSPHITRSTDISSQNTEVLINWFECIECEESQLINVKELGAPVVPILIQILNEGLPIARKIELINITEETYEGLVLQVNELNELSADDETLSLISKEEFVKVGISRFDTIYRIKAALALGEIGGNEAIDALDNAMKNNSNLEVEHAIARALIQALNSKN